jgi:ABC-type nitrate/sulfonate/bicarbonate transport system permease component
LVDREDVLALTLISVAIGLALAVAYHLLSTWLQGWVTRHSAAMVPAFVILGFLVRLTLIGLILVVLGLWTSLNIVAVCIAFVALFTILTGYSLYRFAKRPTTPPSAGADGTVGGANAS